MLNYIMKFMIDEKQIQSVAKLLIKNKKTISVAESCTGGLLSHILTNIPGSSNYFKLGIIAYSNNAKSKLLKIPKSQLSSKGAVSQEVAMLMSKNIKKISKTDMAVAITGIAGPNNTSKNKKVGLTYISITTNKKTKCKEFLFKGNRKENKYSSVKNALIMLEENLKDDGRK